MSTEVYVWLIVNVISLLASLHDLYDTHRVWRWTLHLREATREDLMVTFRSFRLSAVRTGMAVLFLFAGALAALKQSPGWIWALIFAATLLTLDVFLEARFRTKMYRRPRDIIPGLGRDDDES